MARNRGPYAASADELRAIDEALAEPTPEERAALLRDRDTLREYAEPAGGPVARRRSVPS